MDDSVVRQITGSIFFNWVGLNAAGTSGGILLMWDSHKWVMLDQWTRLFSISVVVRDLELNKEWIISAIYGPSSSGSREFLEGIAFH